MRLASPRIVAKAKGPFMYSTNRLNALFLSEVMGDNDSIRKLIHEDNKYAGKVLTALYVYYKSGDKQQLIETLRPLEEKLSGSYGLGIKKDKNGDEILVDWSSGRFGGFKESLWADLSLYDVKQTIMVRDDMNRPPKMREYKDVTVAEVLSDTINNRTYDIENCPVTGNEQLDVLLKKLYNEYDDKRLHEPTFYKTIKMINNDLIESFKGGKEAEARAYIPAVIMLDNLSVKFFDNIDYRAQYGFYKSDIGQELLKFSYLTTFESRSVFDEKHMEKYLKDIKESGLWQIAHSKIAIGLSKNKAYGSLLNQRLSELIIIRPRPKEKMYHGYYENDLRRANYMNLYLNYDKKR